MVRIATCDEKPGECISDTLGVRVGRVGIQMPQCRADVATALHRPGEFAGGPP